MQYEQIKIAFSVLAVKELFNIFSSLATIKHFYIIFFHVLSTVNYKYNPLMVNNILY